jgi:SAM-dependent methyltransferase
MNRIKETINYYNGIANKSFSEWFNNDALLPVLELFRASLGEKPLVLDLGCGTGGESKRMINLGIDVIGIDYSLESIKLARSNVPRARFLYEDIRKMLFNMNSFDGVIEAGVMFHFNYGEQLKIIRNIKNILKENGVFLSIYPEGEYEGNEQIEYEGKTYKRYARRIDRKKWRKQIEKMGLVFINEIPVNIGPFKGSLFKK